jgi:PadR family transcriptional regulator PadR
VSTELLVLAALEAREMYGREIQQAVALITKSKRKFSAGALYTTLHRLEKKGVISGRWGDDSETRDGARRRYYRITGAGARELAEARQALTMSQKRLKPLLGNA